MLEREIFNSVKSSELTKITRLKKGLLTILDIRFFIRSLVSGLVSTHFFLHFSYSGGFLEIKTREENIKKRFTSCLNSLDLNNCQKVKKRRFQKIFLNIVKCVNSLFNDYQSVTNTYRISSISNYFLNYSRFFSIYIIFHFHSFKNTNGITNFNLISCFY